MDPPRGPGGRSSGYLFGAFLSVRPRPALSADIQAGREPLLHRLGPTFGILTSLWYNSVISHKEDRGHTSDPFEECKSKSFGAILVF